jgi:Ca2+-dependent lipid-binding protein
MPDGTLEVFVIEGRNLKDQDMVGQNDAYVEIYTDKKYKQRTKTISNTNNPTWKERFTFNIHKGDDTIHFDVNSPSPESCRKLSDVGIRQFLTVGKYRNLSDFNRKVSDVIGSDRVLSV